MLVRTNIKIRVFSLHMSYSPIKDIEILIFNALIRVGILLGNTTFVNIFILFAPKDFNSVI